MSRKHQPKGFEILYEDRDLIVGNKAAGSLAVAALWNKEDTVHAALNTYVRKGNARSKKCVFVVHRLDQATSGVMIFAKTGQAQAFLKDNWATTKKIYYAVVHGRLAQKSGTISNHLIEDEDYCVRSTTDRAKGKLARTAYTVVKETGKFSLLKVDLLTGRKNQIRVHLADLGHPVVGDDKYGKSDPPHKRLALHSQSVSFTHPFNGKRLTFTAPVPEYFTRLIGPWTPPAEKQ
ncbi:MAG TPA: RNA pseudouridine synthase [Candidatus Omnitrophica bacterium]|nr:MAG: RNA pseudouridine synthase [Omnitrophica WOR_2 bacterium GWA2_53_43]HBO96533.1 RNA pseudouridine synthase [Candidatus Omnitrophota bacterium]HCI44418.1 RNA pseudouridine synthase [Candidatus Omnitrophota bacterium]